MKNLAMVAAGVHTLAVILFFFNGNFSAAIAHFAAACWAFIAIKDNK